MDLLSITVSQTFNNSHSWYLFKINNGRIIYFYLELTIK